jgi:hypothetical protein
MHIYKYIHVSDEHMCTFITLKIHMKMFTQFLYTNIMYIHIHKNMHIPINIDIYQCLYIYSYICIYFTFFITLKVLYENIHTIFVLPIRNRQSLFLVLVFYFELIIARTSHPIYIYQYFKYLCKYMHMYIHIYVYINTYIYIYICIEYTYIYKKNSFFFIYCLFLAHNSWG